MGMVQSQRKDRGLSKREKKITGTQGEPLLRPCRALKGTEARRRGTVRGLGTRFYFGEQAASVSKARFLSPVCLPTVPVLPGQTRAGWPSHLPSSSGGNLGTLLTRP